MAPRIKANASIIAYYSSLTDSISLSRIFCFKTPLTRDISQRSFPVIGGKYNVINKTMATHAITYSMILCLRKAIIMKNTTQKIVMASLFASLACVATMIIKIPSPLKGYLNLGDCVVLLSGWIISPMYGFLAAGIGSALADLFSGYVAYMPATFIIKGLMALIAHYGFKLLQNKIGNLPSRIVSGAVAEIVMILGYFVFEGFLYGFVPSIVNIPANVVQGTAGLILGTVLIKIFEKNRIM